MKSSKAINWYERDPEEVYDLFYGELDDGKKYPFFSWLMEHFPDLEIDWLETFEEIREGLFHRENIDAVLSFVEWYKLKNPDDYKERFEFIERDLCNYFFFKKDIEKLRQRIAFIQENPVASLDTLTVRLLYQLIYHGHYDLALSYAETVWKPINESDAVIGFASYPFISTVYVHQLQQYHEANLNGVYLDEDKLFRQITSMGFEEDISIFNVVLQALKEDFSKEVIEDSIKRGKDDHMLILNIHFLKYMLNTYKLPFIFSEWMWNFIADTKIFGKQKGIENWFYLDAKTLDKHIVDNLDSFFGSNQLEIFGKVWGLDFVFDFLHQQQLLSSEHYKKMVENIIYFRNQMMRIAYGNLWQMMFVFNWPRTNNYIIDSSEENIFKKTFGKDASEVYEKVNRFLSIYQIPDRINEELKLDTKKERKPLPIWTENKPYIKEGPEVGRNDLCPCGSGKKYKKCCMK